MASGSHTMDVSEQFQKMAEKFGWLKHGDLDQALKSLSKSTKKKKSTKSRVTEKKKKGEASKTAKSKIDIPVVSEHKTSALLSNSNTSRKPDLTGFLSSDSDSSFTTIPDVATKPVARLRVLCSDSSFTTAPDTIDKPSSCPRVICSDSEEEEKPKEDTYISCIGESDLWMTGTDTEGTRLSASPSNNGRRNRAQVDRKSFNIDDNEESILRNRLSMMSLISDIDSIGEPLVESTRIHRRSSVTYQHLIDSTDGEDSDKHQFASSKTINKVRRVNTKNIYNRNSDPVVIAESPEVSPVKDVKYVTALEILVDEAEETHKEETASSSDRGVLDTSRTSSNEYVEVTDVATQTENLDTPVKLCTPKHNNPVCQLYMDDTLDSSNNKPAYTELTVVESVLGENSSELDFQSKDIPIERRNCVSEMSAITSNCEVTSPYDQTTLSNISTNSIPKKIDFDTTQIGPGDELNIYSHITVDMTTIEDCASNKDEINLNKVVKRNLNEGSKTSIDGESAVFTEISTNMQSDHEVFDELEESILSNSNTSIYEVVDVSTQTESENRIVNDKNSNLNHSNTDDKVDEAYCNGSFENSDTDISLSNCNSSNDKSSKNEEECFDEDLDTCAKTKGNISGSSLSEQNDSNLSDRRGSCHTQNSTNFGESVFNSNSSSSIKPNPGTKRQKASHCFDISSDSDTEADVDDTNTDRVNNEYDSSNSSVDNQSVSDSNDVKESTRSKRKESNSDSGGEHYVKVRPGRSESKVTDRPSVDKNLKNDWRDSKRKESESSSDDNLEAFIQKLKNPENPEKKKSSESSHKSMKDFIVEDDEMTSESDDEVFYIKETQKLDRAPLVERLNPNNDDNSQSEESSDEAFSSKLYPSSVTKHKKKRQQGKSHASSVCSSLYWDSSDSDTDGKGSRPHGNKTNSDTYNKGTRSHNTEINTNGKATWQLPISDTGSEKGKHKPGTKKYKNPDYDSDEDNNITGKCDAKQTIKSKTRNIELKQQKDVNLSNSDQDSALFKTPNPIRKSKSSTSNIPNRSGSSTSIYKTPLLKTSSATSLSDYISLSDDDSSSDDDSLPSLHTSNKENVPDYQTPRRTKLSSDADIFKTPLSSLKTQRFSKGSEGCGHSFLKSLSNNVEDTKRHPEATKYIRNFKKTREELVKELFELYNDTIFDKQLPEDLPIIWNKRLLKTAGYCAYRCSRANKEDRTARIELSTKVCDSAERVRDTLIHELCHAAVWLLNGVNGGHGNFWRYWARHASRVHPELPTISRCHSYSINTKFTYRCTRCGYSIGRHSKSLDTSKKICGYCKGTFELILNATPMTPQSASSATSSVGSTPRTPNRFAMFVKDNYNTVKQKNKDLKHGDVMKELSRMFAANKINS